jgi:hypothetical protein
MAAAKEAAISFFWVFIFRARIQSFVRKEETSASLPSIYPLHDISFYFWYSFCFHLNTVYNQNYTMVKLAAAVYQTHSRLLHMLYYYRRPLSQL